MHIEAGPKKFTLNALFISSKIESLRLGLLSMIGILHCYHTRYKLDDEISNHVVDLTEIIVVVVV